jgi:hypothetical protein
MCAQSNHMPSAVGRMREKTDPTQDLAGLNIAAKHHFVEARVAQLVFCFGIAVSVTQQLKHFQRIL